MDFQWLLIVLVFVTFHQSEADEFYDSEVEQLVKFYEADEEPFSAHNCDATDRDTVPLYLNEIKITPSPIQLGQLLIVNVSFTLNEDIGVNGDKIEIDLSIRLKTPWGYTEVCNFFGDEFCHTNDLCPYIAEYQRICGKQKSKCQCPLLKETYTIKKIPIPLKELPFDLVGAFDVTIRIKEQGKHLGCIETHFCIGKCRPQLV